MSVSAEEIVEEMKIQESNKCFISPDNKLIVKINFDKTFGFSCRDYNVDPSVTNLLYDVVYIDYEATVEKVTKLFENDYKVLECELSEKSNSEIISRHSELITTKIKTNDRKLLYFVSPDNKTTVEFILNEDDGFVYKETFYGREIKKMFLNNDIMSIMLYQLLQKNYTISDKHPR